MAQPDLQSCYTVCDDVIVLGGSGKWQRAILHLPDARFGKGENWQADLRLSAWSLAVRRLEVSLTRRPTMCPAAPRRRRSRPIAPTSGRGWS